MLDFNWRCRDGVALTRKGDRVRLRVAGRADVPVALPAEAAQAAVRLNDGLSDHAIGVASGDVATAARLFRLKRRLQEHGLLVVDLICSGRRLATLRPHAATFDPLLLAARPARPAARWTLSRFAFLHREDRHLVLECPESPCEIVLEDRDLVQWIHDAAACVAPQAGTAQSAVMALLAALAIVEDADEEESPARRTWEFHDRLFHRRTRDFEDFRPYGGTYRFREGSDNGYTDRLPSPPVIRAPHAGGTIDLPVPESTAGGSLQRVMEIRRSKREMGDEPVSLAQVAALLHRVARVTRRLPGDRLQRPYPAAGAIHELEFYLAVGACRGLAPGFYHYRSDIHAATKLCRQGAAGAAAAMISYCAEAWGTSGRPPQCLIVVTSRLPRLAWKYAAIAYRLSLLNAGVVLQSLQLVATDIGLNGAAAGSGKPALFAEATGVSSWEETSIAEFGFGSRPEPVRLGAAGETPGQPGGGLRIGV